MTEREDDDDVIYIDLDSDEVPDGPVPKDGSICWDTHYDSPKADLILISKDMVGFRVDSWLMAKKCQFVEDLRLVPSEEALDDSPVHLDYSSATVRVFIDLVCTRHILAFKTIKLNCLGYEELFKLCDQFEAPEIANSLAANLRAVMKYPTTGLDPWRVFKVAAQRNDVELARLSAVKIHGTGSGLGEVFFNNPPSFFDGIPSRYMAALMRSAFKSIGPIGPKESVPIKAWIQRKAGEIDQAFKME